MNYQELISEFWTNAIESHWFIRGAQCRAEGRWTDEPVWTDRQISNWLKKHRPALESYMAEVRETFPQIFAMETP